MVETKNCRVQVSQTLYKVPIGKLTIVAFL